MSLMLQEPPIHLERGRKQKVNLAHLSKNESKNPQSPREGTETYRYSSLHPGSLSKQPHSPLKGTATLYLTKS